MKAFVSGGAGFIGSNLVDRLLDVGHEVTVYDNLSTGLLQFLEYARDFDRFRLVEGDLLDEDSLSEAIGGHEFVFHPAANADVRFGTEHPRRDLEQNTIVTNNVLEAMRKNGISKIAFASTGSVYGDATVIPTPENAPFLFKLHFTQLQNWLEVAGEPFIAHQLRELARQGVSKM